VWELVDEDELRCSLSPNLVQRHRVRWEIQNDDHWTSCSWMKRWMAWRLRGGQKPHELYAKGTTVSERKEDAR
jgi:hypothetical protein